MMVIDSSTSISRSLLFGAILLLAACGSDEPENIVVINQTDNNGMTTGQTTGVNNPSNNGNIGNNGTTGQNNGGMTGGNFVDDKDRLAQGNDVLLQIIAEGKINGSRIMPAQKALLSEQEMKDALSYIRKQFGGQ